MSEDPAENRSNEEILDNYFKITEFKDRIRDSYPFRIRFRNEIMRILFVSIVYFFGNTYSGYLYFLDFQNSLNYQNFQFLTGFIFLTVLANLWGPISGGLGALFGELIYQTSSLSTIKWEFLLISVLIGSLAGAFRYDKEKTMPKLKIMKFFYSLIIGALISAFLTDTSISIAFLMSELISFVFLSPLIIVLIDRILLHTSNNHGVIYSPILTHHWEMDSDHAIPVKIDGYYIFLCTRCTGTVIGIFLGLFIERILFFSGTPLSANLALTLSILLPIPGLVDWGTQKLLFRKSNDIIRIITGILLGLAMHMITFTGDLIYVISVITVIYFGVFSLLYYIGTKKLRKFEID
jgi:uncharacterized membrane protein